MTADQKRERVQELRELPQPRSPAEQGELDALASELRSLEAANLSATTQRIRLEREQTVARNRTLENLATRRSALLARVEGTLAEARAERQAIDGELATMLAGVSGSAGE